MRNIVMKIRFDGTAYHGFQSQDNAVAVANVVEKALAILTSEKITVTGCSRTDAGVHAEEFCLNFHTESALTERNFLCGMNANLPPDIAVFEVSEADNGFNARFDTVSKEYKYLILNSPVRNPFYENRALHYPREIDMKLFSDGCKDYIGTHDFKAFCSAGSSVKSTVRTVYSCSAEKKGDIIEFRVCADGFLYNMVRIMVGTLIDINEGKIAPGSIPLIISTGDRSLAGRTAKGSGLYLSKVNYRKG